MTAPAKAQHVIPPRLLTQEGAAAYLAVSLSTFKKHVRCSVKPTYVGSSANFDIKDLDAWVESQKAGTSPGLLEEEESLPSVTSDSPLPGVASSGRRVKQIRERLLRKQRASTPSR